jgi:hypothetical protein
LPAVQGVPGDSQIISESTLDSRSGLREARENSLPVHTMSKFSEESPRHCPWSQRASANSVEVAEEEPTPSGGQQGEPLPALHPADELLSRSPFDAPLSGRTAAETALLAQVARWSKDFLTNPHPALGRAGPVCPYVRASIQEHRFLLTLLQGAAAKQRETDHAILRLGRQFLQLEPTTGRGAQFKTIVILLPDLKELEAADIVNAIHQRLKQHFLQQGLMLGEFFKASSKPGLHNPQFRPLQSDTPLLVIRPMVPTDIAFLSDEAAFARTFLENFGARGRAEILHYLERQKHSLPQCRLSLLLGLLEEFEAPAKSSVWPTTA